MPDLRIISIGALSQNEMWPEDPGGRTAHATCSLVRSGDATILVDPGLPGPAITQRIAERAGLKPKDITHIFMTSFHPAHRRGIDAFPDAQWLIAESEREAVGIHLIQRFEAEENPATKEALKQDIALLKNCQPAPDKIAPQVDLFPVPGYTPGTCGLLLADHNATTVIAGDSVLSQEHFEAGRIPTACFDHSAAEASLKEVIEIADIIVPGHDNVMTNRTRGAFG